jgi:hypothetical protein
VTLNPSRRQKFDPTIEIIDWVDHVATLSIPEPDADQPVEVERAGQVVPARRQRDRRQAALAEQAVLGDRERLGEGDGGLERQRVVLTLAVDPDRV